MKKQDKKNAETLMNSDRFVSHMLSNIETARGFFKFVLPKNVSELLDLETLQNERNRLTSTVGKDRFGDFFFTANLRDPSKSAVKRPLFAIILEHKSQDEAEVVLQLAEYIIGLIRMMRSNPELYADEDGKLPAPYAIVFSQDWGSKRILSLKDMLRALPGLEDTIPNFNFQYFRICDATLEEIAKCDPLTDFFLYLARLINAPFSDEEKEAEEIAKRASKCLTTPDPDLRMRDGVTTCMGYLKIIQKRRPKTPSNAKVYKKMKLAETWPSNKTLVKEWFGDVYVELENAKLKERQKTKKEHKARIKAEAESKANTEARIKAEAESKANTEARIKAEAESKANAERTARATARVKEFLFKELEQRFPSSKRERLNSMIDSIDDYYVLDKVYDISRDYQTIAEITAAVGSYLKTDANK